MEVKLQKVDTAKTYKKVNLTEATDSGYILISAEVDKRIPFLPSSKAKRILLGDIKRLCKMLKERTGVKRATLFEAFLIPPGRGEFLKRRPDVHVARFDIAVLIETPDIKSAQDLRKEGVFIELKNRVDDESSYTHIITATNIKRIGPVDHKHNGIFLFNYFYADDTGQNLAAWEYTAGWFEQETSLNNSIVLLPAEGEDSEYSIINHCRWNHLWSIMPSLLFKSSFRSYVLKSFEANDTAAMPILYRLA